MCCFWCTALQKLPEGETRIPTDQWSGFGFSKSMPESVVRDRLGQLGLIQLSADDEAPVNPWSQSLMVPLTRLLLWAATCGMLTL